MNTEVSNAQSQASKIIPFNSAHHMLEFGNCLEPKHCLVLYHKAEINCENMPAK